MTHFYDYPQIIDRVSGLNSVSTLKKWRLKIEQLTGHTFEESRVRTGKRSYSKVYLFTDEDVGKLQKIADLKEDIGLEKAIIKAYAPSRASPLSTSQQIQRLTIRQGQIETQLKDLTDREQILSSYLNQLEKRLEELEHPKKRKLFGK